MELNIKCNYINNEIKCNLIQNQILRDGLDKNKLVKKLSKINNIGKCKYKINDCHTHIVNFNQETEGLKKMIKYMDKANIDKAVIFGLGLTKKYSEMEKYMPKYYLEDDNPVYYFHHTDTILVNEYKKLTKKEQKRFFPLLSGFNPMDINSVKHIRYTLENNLGVFSGIGEVLYRHDDLTLLTYGEPPRMNTKATYELFKLAAEYDLPICFHNNISSTGQSDYPKFLYEMEEALRYFPRVKAIFSHCGYSRRIKAPFYIEMLSRLLDTYPNLYIDYSWIVFDELINTTEENLEKWVIFSEKYSDRIMIGSDLLGDSLYKIGLEDSKYNDFLSRLSKKARDNIAYKNVEKVYTNNKKNINKKIKFPNLEEFKK